MSKLERYFPKPDKNFPLSMKIAYWVGLLLNNVYGPTEAFQNPEEKKTEEITVFSH